MEQGEGDIKPSLYINQEEALILEKKVDGENLYHELTFDKETNTWVKELEKEKMGNLLIHPNENESKN
ncbi:hypothetical protein [Cytobacillus massiliigabonensis]|uniref:hypothetical protein n=1 Tax=Cytobacillus massiliigabonensis TaxID=1871011 RepID=UPI000C82F7D9|nr:hypothetical protein [Cytobacillus massiliigabonensis]